MKTLNPITIEPDLFAAAACMLPGERGALSPLEEFGGGKLTKKAVQTLKKKGLISAAGGIDDNFRQILDDLIDPVHLFSMDLLNEKQTSGYSVFFKDPESQPVSLHTTPENIEIQRDDVLLNAQKEIGEYLACKKPAKGDFALTVPLEYAWVLAAVLDLQSRKPRKTSTGAKAAPAGLKSEEISKTLAQFDDSPAWPWLSMLSILAETDPGDDVDIEAGLAWLVKNGLLGKKTAGYLPAGAAGEISQQAAQPSAVLNLLTAQKITVLHIEYQKLACFGAENAVYGLAYRVGEESAHFIKRPLEDLLKVVEGCMQEPLPLYAVLGIRTEEILSIPCPACGVLQNPASKFCKDCGAAFAVADKLEAIPEYTPEAAPQSAKVALRGKLSQKSQEYAEVETVDRQAPAKKKRRWWLILLIIFAVILVGCLIASIFVPITIKF